MNTETTYIIETTPDFLTEQQLVLKEKNKKYYIENKEILHHKYKSKVQCPLCDRFVCKGSLNTHFKGYLCDTGQNKSSNIKFK